jgi:hypothetical protein
VAPAWKVSQTRLSGPGRHCGMAAAAAHVRLHRAGLATAAGRECQHPPEIHRQCAQDYLTNDDDKTPGLWQYIHDAIIAKSQRAADGQDHPAAG